MSNRPFALAAVALFWLGACRSEGPTVARTADDQVIDLVPDYVASSAAVIDGAGVGGSEFPDSLRLTADQKAAIQALHEAFTNAHAQDVATLRELEKQAHALKEHGGTREQIAAILQQAKPILERLAHDFAKLQEAIWQIYTPAQRAWIESHRPKVCSASNTAHLTDAQVQQIRALREAFLAAVAADLAFIKQVHEQAEAARKAGKSRTEIEAILATAQPALDRIRAAEGKLEADIKALLTPEQRAAWCVIRSEVGPPRHH